LNLSLFLFGGLLAILLVALLWALRVPMRLREPDPHAALLEETGKRHVNFLPQIRQALAETDTLYLSRKAPALVVRRVRRERRRIALAYLSAVREDFQNLLRMAKIIARLSPEVVTLHEFERVRLTLVFVWHYQMVRLQLRAGLVPIPGLDGLSDLVSGLSVRMETAMNELGERAALASKMASSFDGSDVA
jgi:hypothetical protein